MSEYLGFEPSKSPVYFFLSYNSEDKDRVSNIAKPMIHSGINLWYDFGIDYGEHWEEIITKKIKDSQGVLLLFTKGILIKYNSYVQKEYKIAKFLKRKVYIALLDRIREEDIPEEKIPWWIDINDNQTVNLFEVTDIDKIIERLSRLLNIQTHENRMNLIISKYNELYFEGQTDAADEVLKEYLHGVSVMGKAEVIANIVRGGFEKTHILSPAEDIKHLQSSLKTHTGREESSFYECKKIKVNSDTFIIGNGFVFHRGNHGDAHVIWIWKNGDLIHTIGGLIEARDLEVLQDSIDNIVYIACYSDIETIKAGEDDVSESVVNITVIEYPNETAICTDFRF